MLAIVDKSCQRSITGIKFKAMESRELFNKLGHTK